MNLIFKYHTKNITRKPSPNPTACFLSPALMHFYNDLETTFLFLAREIFSTT